MIVHGVPSALMGPSWCMGIDTKALYPYTTLFFYHVSCDIVLLGFPWFVSWYIVGPSQWSLLFLVGWFFYFCSVGSLDTTINNTFSSQPFPLYHVPVDSNEPPPMASQIGPVI